MMYLMPSSMYEPAEHLTAKRWPSSGEVLTDEFTQ
jgi:hypothetical protein